MNEDQNRIVLLDEEGNEVEFELVVTIEKDGVEYALLLNIEDEDMYAFRMDKDDQGDLLIPVENDDEIAMIQELYDQLSADEE